MKAVLEFDLNDYDDKEQFQKATKGSDAHMVIFDMFQELRKVWKYSEDEVAVEHADSYREILARLCEDYGVEV